MKSSKRVAVCGILCALSVTFLLLTALPYTTYAFAVLSGMVFLVAALEYGTRYAVLCYIVSAVLAFFFTPDQESKWLFIVLLGYYPVLHLRLKRINRWIAWILKLLLFNATAVAMHRISLILFHISPDEYTVFGTYSPYLFLILGNIVFVIYDFAIDRAGVIYRVKIHPLIIRYIR